MTHNMGRVDRGLRVFLGLVLAGIAFMGTVQGILQIVAGVFAVILLGTSLIGFCLLYTVLGISTCPRKGSA